MKQILATLLLFPALLLTANQPLPQDKTIS